MNYLGKHVYIIPEVDRFFYLHSEFLVNEVGVKPEDLCAIYISSDVSKVISGYPGISYVNSHNVDFSELKKAKTITCLSLSPYNSEFISDLIKFDYDILNFLYILITDDEVDRWNINYQKYGRLRVSKENQITINDLFVLSHIKNFIGFENVFKNKIESMLGRNVFFVNTGCLFKILPSNDHNTIRRSFSIKNTTKKTKRVWFHTKPFGKLSDFINVSKAIVAFYKEYRENLHFVIFSGGKKSRLALNILITVMTAIYAKKMKVDLLSTTDSYSYMQHLMACDFIILQRRGGCGAARILMQTGRGMVCTLDHTENQEKLETAYNISLIKGESYEDLAKKTNKKNVELDDIAEKISKMESVYISQYKSLYC